MLRSLYVNLHFVHFLITKATTHPSPSAGKAATTQLAESMSQKEDNWLKECARDLLQSRCLQEQGSWTISRTLGYSVRCTPPVQKTFTGHVFQVSEDKDTDYIVNLRINSGFWLGFKLILWVI